MSIKLKQILYTSLAVLGFAGFSGTVSAHASTQVPELNPSTQPAVKVTRAQNQPIAINQRQTSAIQVNARRKYHTPALNLQIRHLASRRRQYHHPDISWNFRDIGGYNTARSTYHVRKDKLFVSSYLPQNISWRGARDLKRLHVHTDIDMRNYRWSPTSIQRHKQPGEDGAPDPRHLKLRYLHYPIESSALERRDWKKVPSSRINDLYDEAKRFRYQYDRTPLARWTLRRSMYALMKYTNGNNAIMFNCSDGRDRSECLVAVVLGTLGVNNHMIRENYLLTNHYRWQTSYYNQIHRINNLLGTIHKYYGNMDNFDRKGLHLSNNFLKAFRHHFLIRNRRATKTINL